MVFSTPVLLRTINPVLTRFPSGLPDAVGYRRRLWWMLLGLPLMVSVAWAAGFKVLTAETHRERGLYLLNADIAYRFSEAALDALRNGVPLTIELEMEVLKRREWLWDEIVAVLRQRFGLEYHALSRQYVVTNLNSGELKSFPTLMTATDFFGRIKDFPLLDASLLASNESYYGRLRAGLDVEALPVPLQLVAYLSTDWDLTSEWYTWPL